MRSKSSPPSQILGEAGVLEDEVDVLVVFEAVVEPEDVRMVERLHDIHFGLESLYVGHLFLRYGLDSAVYLRVF